MRMEKKRKKRVTFRTGEERRYDRKKKRKGGEGEKNGKVEK